MTDPLRPVGKMVLMKQGHAEQAWGVAKCLRYDEKNKQYLLRWPLIGWTRWKKRSDFREV